jgi:hypothetical protein
MLDLVGMPLGGAALLQEIGIDRYFTYIVTRTVKTAPQPPVALFARSPG